MPTLHTNATHLYYEDAGSGPPVILSHGFGDSAALWAAQIDAFSDRYRLVTYDLRGHARSGCPEDIGLYTEDQLVEDLRAIMDHLHIERAVLGGHSLGGYTSLRFQQRYPNRVRALILSGTGPGYRRLGPAQEWTAQREQVAAEFEARGMDTIVDARAEGIGRHGGQGAIQHRMRGLAYVSRGVMRMPLMVEMSEVAVPAIVLVGEDDTPFRNSSEYIVAKIPAAVGLVVLPHASHWANYDQPEQWNTAVGEFLAGFAN